MGGKETGWFRLEGGVVQEMDLPLHESIQQRVDKGEIVRLTKIKKGREEKFVPYEAPEPEPAGPTVEELEGQLSEATARIKALEAELATVTAERDDLKAKAK